MAIEKNSVWRLDSAEGLESGSYRVLNILPNLDCVILFYLTDENKLQRPISILLSTFTDWINLGVAERIEYEAPYFLLVAEENLEPKYKLKRDTNYSLVSELLEDEEFLFTYSTSKRMLQVVDHAKKNHVDRKKISRLLNLYWRHGQIRNAFLPAYGNSGGLGKERQLGNGILGAPRSSRTLGVERAAKYMLKPVDKENIRKGLKASYLKTTGSTLTESYKEYLRKYHAEEIKIADACQRAPIVPSFRQFRYFKERLFSKDTVIRERSSERDYLLKKRAVLGSASQNDFVPGSCFEIDATVADVHIVSSFGKQYALGRPTIYSIVDRATLMIVGFHVSLYHASWRAARQALVNCFLPKADYCAQYGIFIDESEWPCSHVPKRFMCDNGEMIGLQPQQKVVPFTELSFAPAYRPDYKPFVERRFKILNDQLIHHLIGSTRGGKVVRGDRDPRKDSLHTLREVTTMLIDAALEHNRDIQKSLAFKNSLLIENNLSPTPVNAWRINVSKHMHALSRVEPSEVIASLLPPEQVSMTRSGIKYKEMYYSSLQTEDEKLAAIARTNGRWQLDARVDDNTVNHIYVRLNDKEGFTKCYLSPRNAMFKDMPVSEAEFILDWLDMHKEKAPVTVESIEMKKRHAQLEKQAKERARTNTMPFREKIKNTKENRNEELMRTTHSVSENNENQKVDITPRVNVVAILPRRNRRLEGN
jgi:putative transposase